MKTLKTLALTAMLLATVSTYGQTLHIFNYCNTLDSRIGESVKVDHERLTREALLIGACINYETASYNGIGSACSKENLMSDLDNLRCGKDDIVLFYYSGHGVRSTQDQSPFPQMMLKYEAYQQDKFVPVHTVVEKLSSKGARLVIVLTDCCNSESSMVSAKGESPLSRDNSAIDYEKIEAAYKKLFLENKGIIVATSSKAGQTSECAVLEQIIDGRKQFKHLGGVFSLGLFEYALYYAVLGRIPTQWDSIMYHTSDFISRKGYTQVPYYEARLSSQPTAIPTQTPSQAQPTVHAIDNDFAKDISRLIDAGQRPAQRLSLADELSQKYFSQGAKVATVGRNGSTVVDYENAADWLQRIASSKNIISINIIKESKNNQGMRQYITVQEIRNKK
ncbi:MAG: caspase family protein [Bacteroidales bacterium]|nr:caspase family protein [Bacteroidales bacterium]